MQLGLGNLWRRAARSLGLEEEASKEHTQGPAEAGAVLGWLNEDATAGLASVETIEQSDIEHVVRMRQPVSNGEKVWLIPPAGEGVSGSVRSCDEIAEGFRVSIVLDNAEEMTETGQVYPGRVSLAWRDANGSVCRTRAAMRSGAEGELEISTLEEVPAPSLVLLSSYEYRGFGVAKECRPENDSYRVTVAMTEEVYPQPNAA